MKEWPTFSPARYLWRILNITVQNEDVLKKCAQDYLMRIKQEEQRYQTLKVHAEEKLNK